MHLVVSSNPIEGSLLPFIDFSISEPKSNLIGGTLVGVRSVDDVTSNGNAVVTTNGSWESIVGVGGSEHNTGSLDDSLSFPDHANNGGSRRDVINQTLEEGLGLEVIVVLGSELLAGGEELEGNQFVSLLFKASDNLPNQSTLNTVWLEHDVGPFGRSSENSSVGLLFSEDGVLECLVGSINSDSSDSEEEREKVLALSGGTGDGGELASS